VAGAVVFGLAADALPNHRGQDGLENVPDIVRDAGYEVGQLHRWGLQGLQLDIGSDQLSARVLSPCS
jgi:hypothetical protein